jgi:hypothetical protein
VTASPLWNFPPGLRLNVHVVQSSSASHDSAAPGPTFMSGPATVSPVNRLPVTSTSDPVTASAGSIVDGS